MIAVVVCWPDHPTLLHTETAARWRYSYVWRQNNLMASLSCRHAALSATRIRHKLALVTATATDKTARVTRPDLRRRSGICESDAQQRRPAGRLGEPIKFRRASYERRRMTYLIDVDTKARFVGRHRELSLRRASCPCVSTVCKTLHLAVSHSVASCLSHESAHAIFLFPVYVI